MADELRFDDAGALVVPARRLGDLAEAEPAELRLVRLGADLLICKDGLPGQRPQPLIYGDLRFFHTAELLALISSMRKDGCLSLLVPHARKAIHFTDGEVVAASSTVEDDRLGEVLWRRGLLSLEQLSQVGDHVGPGRKLGQLLIQRGLLSPRQLYDGLREQVLEIVYSTFHLHTGEFVFIERAEPPRTRLRLEQATREIIREGVRRVQEMTRLEELLPDADAVPWPRPFQVQAELSDHQRHLLGLCDGRRSVGQIIEQSHLGALEARRGLARLQSSGLLEIRARSATEQREAGGLGEVLEGYARLIRRIQQTLAAEAPDGSSRLQAFLSLPASRHREVLQGVALDGDGRLDVETLARNARRLDAAGARELALGALRAFYDYAVFQAMDALDEETFDALLARLDDERAKMGG